MRLLNVRTLQFCEFYDAEIPAYVILSHTWGRTEMSYQTFKALFPPEDVFASNLYKSDDFNDTHELLYVHKRLSEPQDGLIKILNLCRLASKTELQWVWVDTCCINKESSAELSEAINSMYNWYSSAKACIVFLEDVRQHSVGPNSESNFSMSYNEIITSMKDNSLRDSTHPTTIVFLKRSRWFTRGWCLQELIAPNNVRFFDRSWAYIGSKIGLAPVIEEITGIDSAVLMSQTPTVELDQFSVAMKMSWAAQRETTRIEDIAYSLMGLFGINMTLQYGEGEKAFLRLQRKIMKTVSDETLLAWNTPGHEPGKSLTGLLAPHPRAFLMARDLTPLATESTPIAITSRGACISILYPDKVHAVGTFRNNVMLPLNCARDNDIVCVPIAKLGGTWYRVNAKSKVPPYLETIGWLRDTPLRSIDRGKRGDLYVSLKSCPQVPLWFIHAQKSALMVALRLEKHWVSGEIIRTSTTVSMNFQNHGP